MSIFRRTRYLSSPLRLQNLMLTQQEWKHTVAAGGGEKDSASSSLVELVPPSASSGAGSFDSASWKKMDSRSLGIRNSAIESSAWLVLNILKEKGFGAYLVGGCVRDLLLHKTPKDFDVVTTAHLEKIRKHFHRTQIIGRRFPICLIYFKDSYIEVSSFQTMGENAKDRLKTLCSQSKINCDQEDIVRWRNCMQRDFTINSQEDLGHWRPCMQHYFTINSLLYDPCTNTIYDYVNGIKDIKACKVRTVIPALVSFKEDCARILRGIRVAARLGLKFSNATKAAIIDLSSSVRSLPKDRLMMEMNYMLAYGAAVPSIHLLKKFKLLEILLPLHDHLLQQAKTKNSENSTMLMALFSKMDMIISADRPSDCRLWLGLLAFHLALVECPQDALTLWTFSSFLYHGNMSKALRSAKDNAEVCFQFVPEISGFSGTKSDELILEDISHFVSLIKSSIEYLICPDALAEAIGRFQLPSSTSLVFVSKNMGRNVVVLFDVFDSEVLPTAIRRMSYDINYKLLKKGDSKEVRFVLGKIIMDVLNAGVKPQQKVIVSKKEKIGNEKFSTKIEKERILMTSRSKEEKSTLISKQNSERTKISNEVNPEVDKVISKKRKERNQKNYGFKQNKSEVISNNTREQCQIGDGIKQEQSLAILKNQLENKMNNCIKLENQVVLDNKAERNKMVKKLKQEKSSIKMEKQAMVENRIGGNNVENKTKQEKSQVLKEKKKPEKMLVNEKQLPLLSELFR